MDWKVLDIQNWSALMSASWLMGTQASGWILSPEIVWIRTVGQIRGWERRDKELCPWDASDRAEPERPGLMALIIPAENRSSGWT